MPSKYVIREFSKDSIYHVFNTGVEKRVIFYDDEDYHLFLYYLYIYLTPLEKVLRRYHALPIRLFNKNVAKDVDLLTYCLMPNHFHLILKQKSDVGISVFMKQLSNAYTQYFNAKYKRTGGLFQGRYKAARVKPDDQLSHISRYIHLDPVIAGLSKEPEYPWSSYGEYIDSATTLLCNRKPVLGLFASIYSYKKFVHDRKDYQKHLGQIKGLVIE